LLSYKSELNALHIKIVDESEEYGDVSITRRFTNKKISPRDFVKNLDADYVKKFIRPFIAKRIASVISLAMEANLPVYFRPEKEVAIYKGDKITIQSQAADIVFNFEKLDNETRYFQTIRHNGNIINLTNKNGSILTNDPCWLFLGNKLYHFEENVDGNKLRIFFSKEFIQVPARLEANYYSTFVKTCVENFPVNAKGFMVDEVKPQKAAVLSIEKDISGAPALVLRFRYNSNVVVPQNPKVKFVLFDVKEAFDFQYFFRDMGWESGVVQTIVRLGLKCKYDNYYLVAGEDAGQYKLIGWLNQYAAELTAAEIEVKQEFSDISYYTGNIKMEISYTEQNDWFDVYALAKFGDDFEIPMIRLRNYLLNGIREYELPNGKIAILPQHWFRKYEDLIVFGEGNSNAIQVKKHHFPLIEQSIDGKINVVANAQKSETSGDLGPADPVPAGIEANLRSYQLEGFRWLNKMRKTNLGVCLADDMGLGKTLQTLCVLMQNISENETLPTPGPAKISVQLDLFAEPEPEIRGLSSIVIMPASLLHNWADEIRKFAPAIKFLKYSGQQRSELFDKFSTIDLLLTTYGTIRNDIDLLEGIAFDYVILDESQLIKNPMSKIARAVQRLNSNHRINLSGTPIENSLTDLWSQMNFLNKGLLGDLRFFKKYFATPIEKNKDPVKQEKLQLLISPFFLRRTKLQVEKELPELNEEFIRCEMCEGQKQLYLDEKSKIRNYILQSIEERGLKKSGIVILQGLSKLRQMANHPKMIFADYRKGSGKFDEIIRNLKTIIGSGHKILLFSSYVKHLKLIEHYLQSTQTGYSMLTGASRNRQKIIKQFQEEKDKKVFLITMKAGGVGLNLTQADYVFLLDPWWNPAVESQAVNRAHRIGQRKHVFAYRFITMDTIEEKILNLQRKKSALADIFVRTSNPLKDLSIENINELID
jgi:superfamily II DNA or RNA helicase